MMWLGKKAAGERSEDAVSLARSTIAGDRLGVYDGYERRGVTVYAPGGYIWRPRAGEDILTIKSGSVDAALGTPVKPPAGMESGEVYITSDAASVYLKNDGTILLRGSVTIEGGLTVNGVEIA